MGKSTIDDYLNAIYRCQEKEGAKISDIADLLKVSKASVSEMMRKLKEKHFVCAKKYSKITLNKKGLVEAKRIIHRRRVIRYFYINYLELNPIKARKEIWALDNALSDKTIKALEKKIGPVPKNPISILVDIHKKKMKKILKKD